MSELVIHAITDEQIAQDAPRMRALLAKRYEMVWQTCEPHVNGQRQEDGLGSDPRFIEAGIRTLRDLGRLYRLDKPEAGELPLATGVDVAALVSSRLAVLEARMAQGDPGLFGEGQEQDRS
jgi:hypothetical protein